MARGGLCHGPQQAPNSCPDRTRWSWGAALAPAPLQEIRHIRSTWQFLRQALGLRVPPASASLGHPASRGASALRGSLSSRRVTGPGQQLAVAGEDFLGVETHTTGQT